MDKSSETNEVDVEKQKEIWKKEQDGIRVGDFYSL